MAPSRTPAGVSALNAVSASALSTVASTMMILSYTAVISRMFPLRPLLVVSVAPAAARRTLMTMAVVDLHCSTTIAVF